MRRYHARSYAPARPSWRWIASPALACILCLVACSEEATLPGEPLRIAGGTFVDAVVGRAYDEAVTVSGGLRPYVVRLDEGRLPEGITLQNGVLLGTPTEVGTFTFTVSVRDANLSSTFQEFTVRVVDVPVPDVAVRVPPTEVVGSVSLPVRVDDASNVRALRWELRWWEADDGTTTDAPPGTTRLSIVDVTAARDDLAVTWTQERGRLRVDAVVLGPATSRDGTWFVVDANAPEATVLGFSMTSETLFEDRHTFGATRFGSGPFPGDPSDVGASGDDEDDEDDDEDEVKAP